MSREPVSINASDGRQIELRLWQQSDKPRAIIHVLHGLAEHIDRYARFANVCAAKGYLVVGHNHRGHGAQPDDGLLGHFADADGMSKIIDDAALVLEEMRGRFPSAPVVLLGHSMGSYIAQRFLMERGPRVDALILSGSTWPNRQEIQVARLLSKIMMFFRRGRVHSRFFDESVFKKFNRRFGPNRTEFDWLSRDKAEVDKYVADPLCGSRSTYALWLELSNTLLAISTKHAIARIPAALPILITGGEEDPVGGKRALARLAAEYEASGHQRVKLKLYPDARHEMLNELNRDAVTDDILAWMDAALSDSPDAMS
jgi:alpha-beta hydrolase superfamily lysophospholipase